MNIKDISIEELLKMVNDALKEGVGVNKFSSTNGLKESSVKSKLNRSGYAYNKSLKAYVKIKKDDTKDDIKSDTNNTIKSDVNNNTKIKQLELQLKNKSIENEINNDVKVEHLEKQLKKLEERLNKLESSIDGHKKNNSRKGRYYINNTKDTATKGIRLYMEVKEQLDSYLAAHKDKKVIEVFSYAILDYINKYK
ncbi:hypothetical protein [Clostridium sardiniense]|uniref:hypothetical protein n=1 Tax=Clostridium sardiniense TaxID=29369 RepID=UPI003D337784